MLRSRPNQIASRSFALSNSAAGVRSPPPSAVFLAESPSEKHVERQITGKNADGQQHVRLTRTATFRRVSCGDYVGPPERVLTSSLGICKASCLLNGPLSSNAFSGCACPFRTEWKYRLRCHSDELICGFAFPRIWGTRDLGSSRLSAFPEILHCRQEGRALPSLFCPVLDR